MMNCQDAKINFGFHINVVIMNKCIILSAFIYNAYIVET